MYVYEPREKRESNEHKVQAKENKIKMCGSSAQCKKGQREEEQKDGSK